MAWVERDAKNDFNKKSKDSLKSEEIMTFYAKTAVADPTSSGLKTNI